MTRIFFFEFSQFFIFFFSIKIDDHKKFLNKQRQNTQKKLEWIEFLSTTDFFFFSVRETCVIFFCVFRSHFFVWDFFFSHKNSLTYQHFLPFLNIYNNTTV